MAVISGRCPAQGSAVLVDVFGGHTTTFSTVDAARTAGVAAVQARTQDRDGFLVVDLAAQQLKGVLYTDRPFDANAPLEPTNPVTIMKQGETFTAT